MKKIKSLLFAACALIFITTSCSSDDDSSSPQPTTTFTMSVNGQPFSPTAEPSAVLSNSNRFIIISATNANTSEVITISVGNSGGTGDEITIGSYPITGADNTSFNYFDGNNGFQSDNGGQIEITTLNTETRKVSGTFSGVATGSFGNNTTYTISNGQFNDVTYTIQ